MTILKTAYDTVATQGFVLTKTTDALLVALTHGHLAVVPESPMIKLVEGGASVVDAVPAFAHPLYIAADKDGEQDYLFVDMRQFGKWAQDQMTFVVRNQIEYQLALHRAKLNAIWIKESPTLLRDVSPLPMSAFASWISEAVAKRYALDPREQFNLLILAALFYSSQFRDGAALEEQDKLRLVGSIAKSLKASAQDVLAIVDQIEVMSSINDFCQYAGRVTGSIRLHELNTGVLISIVGSSWFGTNAKEMVAVALEHPPTWLAILMAAISERSYKNSPIAKLLERGTYRDSAQNYLRAVLNLQNVAAS